MENEMTDRRQEIWSAIRYLDPDEEDRARDMAAIITAVALLLVVLVVFVLPCVEELCPQNSATETRWGELPNGVCAF
jgi:hypothetical protein